MVLDLMLLVDDWFFTMGCRFKRLHGGSVNFGGGAWQNSDVPRCDVELRQ